MFSADVYRTRRARLRSRLGSGLVLLPGNHDSPMNYRDNVYPFCQDATFRYFFGLDQPGLIGLIDLDSGEDWLIGEEPGLEDVIWTGPLPTLDERAASAGVALTRPRRELGGLLEKVLRTRRPVHFLPPYRADIAIEIAGWLGLPLAGVAGGVSAELIEAVVALRECKAPEEIHEIEAALEVTAQMHHAAMRASRPGVIEHEVVGVMEGIMRRRDWHLAYPVIFSKRGEVLHNHDHSRTLEPGDLVVNDTGCSSSEGYASDITRTIPVGGKLAGISRELYQIVLDAQQRAIASLAPGRAFVEVHKLAARVLVEGLKEVGCFRGDPVEIVESGAYAIIFQCGVGHQLGLDVHDMENLGEDRVGYGADQRRSTLFGLRNLRLAKPVQPGFVVTVEPGIYVVPALIEQWGAQRRFEQYIDYDVLARLSGIGIRIEDDVLITEDGARVLGPPIARTVAEVEAEMAR